MAVLHVDENGKVHPIANLGGGKGGGGDGLPLLFIAETLSSVVPLGWLSLCVDNGILSGDPESTLYPAFPEAYRQLETLHEAGDTNIISLGDWTLQQIANGGVCGRFGIDITNKLFRLPCMPGMYWRGVMQGLDVGDYQIDTIRRIGPARSTDRANSLAYGTPTDPFYQSGNSGDVSAASNNGSAIYFDTGRLGANFSGTEHRPKTVVIDYQIRMYGTVTDAGTVELAQLIVAMAGKLDTSIYEADAWGRPFASGNINGSNGALSGTNNVISCVRTASSSSAMYTVTIGSGLQGTTYKVLVSVDATEHQIKAIRVNRISSTVFEIAISGISSGVTVASNSSSSFVVFR